MDKKMYDENHKKYESFLNNLLKIFRSSDSCLISGDCSQSDKDYFNLSELIGQKLQDNPYYDSIEIKKVKLIDITSVNETDLNEEELDSNNRCWRNQLPGDKMDIPRYHTDFIFANTEEDA